VQQHHADAMASLASAYDAGRGVPRSSEKSRELYARAADAQHTVSQVYLGYIYYDGLAGVPLDKERARHWFQRAAQQGEPERNSF
jgi:hypothetical protein